MKVVRYTMIASAALMLAAAATVSAQSETKLFEELDRNHNGAISKGEAKEHGELAASFAEIDRDGNNSISVDEYTAYMNRGRMAPEDVEVPEPGAAPVPSY